MGLITAAKLLLKSKKSTDGVIKMIEPTLGLKKTREFLKKLKIKRLRKK